jgi:hypothetical protein
MNSRELEATAYYEAGHAVVGAIRDRPPITVSVVPDGDVAGRNDFPEDWLPEFRGHFGGSPAKRAYIETRILTGVAGTIAHDLRFPGRVHDAGDVNDNGGARAILEDNAGWADDDRDGYFRQLCANARDLLQTNWPWVEAVAVALIVRKTISGAEVMQLRPHTQPAARDSSLKS